MEKTHPLELLFITNLSYFENCQNQNTESKCWILFWDYQVWYRFLHCIVTREIRKKIRLWETKEEIKERSRSQYTSVFENVQKIYLVLRPHNSLTAILCKINHYPKHKYTWKNRLNFVKMYSFQRESDKSEQNKWRDRLCVLSSHWRCRVKHLLWSFYV